MILMVKVGVQGVVLRETERERKGEREREIVSERKRWTESERERESERKRERERPRPRGWRYRPRLGRLPGTRGAEVGTPVVSIWGLGFRIQGLGFGL